MPANPTTPKGLRTRARITEAARKVFARDGYVNMTMSAVKDQAQISLGGLYRYFTDKEDLFEAVVGDVHEELFNASGTTEHSFRETPYEALLDANRGYLSVYYANRDIMRALIEAAGVEPRFRDMWWRMRNRHIDRFATAVRAQHDLDQIDGVPIRLAAEAAACLVEQSAYVWFAQEAHHDGEVSLDDATKIVTRAWYNMFFPAREKV